MDVSPAKAVAGASASFTHSRVRRPILVGDKWGNKAKTLGAASH